MVGAQNKDRIMANEELREITDRAAVLEAMRLFRNLGRDAFIEDVSTPKVSFRPSSDVFVIHDGIGYDSKPLAAAAFRFQHGHPMTGPFYGGDPIRRVFGDMGFQVSDWTSARLDVGQIYSRETLAEMFGITDATINTGVFQPSGTNSIWLFVTRDMTADRTQFNQRLAGDRLYWQGQMTGRTDAKIIAHEDAGDELLVFYRDSKRQHPGAGFRFEGQFRYVSHSGGKPTDFVLERWTAQRDIQAPEVGFDPANVEDGRKKILAEVRRRQGQAGFRRKLLKAYDSQCAVTNCSVSAVLEAAHIHPYLGAETNVTCNGLLLRADIHTLFDCGLISLGNHYSVLVSSQLKETDYAALAGRKIRLPSAKADHPSEKATAWHRKEHGFSD